MFGCLEIIQESTLESGLRNLFFPISIHDIGDDTVCHFIEERLAQEAIVMGKDIIHIEHADDVGHEIGRL